MRWQPNTGTGWELKKRCLVFSARCVFVVWLHVLSREVLFGDCFCAAPWGTILSPKIDGKRWDNPGEVGKQPRLVSLPGEAEWGDGAEHNAGRTAITMDCWGSRYAHVSSPSLCFLIFFCAPALCQEGETDQSCFGAVGA